MNNAFILKSELSLSVTQLSQYTIFEALNHPNYWDNPWNV